MIKINLLVKAIVIGVIITTSASFLMYGIFKAAISIKNALFMPNYTVYLMAGAFCFLMVITTTMYFYYDNRLGGGEQ